MSSRNSQAAPRPGAEEFTKGSRPESVGGRVPWRLARAVARLLRWRSAIVAHAERLVSLGWRSEVNPVTLLPCDGTLSSAAQPEG